MLRLASRHQPGMRNRSPNVTGRSGVTVSIDPTQPGVVGHLLHGNSRARDHSGHIPRNVEVDG